MYYTPYRTILGSWIGGLVAFIIGIIAITYIVFSISSTDAKVESLNQEYSKNDILENTVKELQEKNIGEIIIIYQRKNYEWRSFKFYWWRWLYP